jgi:hypothetical protein
MLYKNAVFFTSFFFAKQKTLKRKMQKCILAVQKCILAVQKYIFAKRMFLFLKFLRCQNVQKQRFDFLNQNKSKNSEYLKEQLNFFYHIK